jgi:hypothetical protein
MAGQPTGTVTLLFSDIDGADGFEPVSSLDDLAYFARQRMEFLKRLSSKKHGIYTKAPAPLGGEVHVVGVDRNAQADASTNERRVPDSPDGDLSYASRQSLLPVKSVLESTKQIGFPNGSLA